LNTAVVSVKEPISTLLNASGVYGVGTIVMTVGWNLVLIQGNLLGW
jgi:hypothetical protein